MKCLKCTLLLLFCIAFSQAKGQARIPSKDSVISFLCYSWQGTHRIFNDHKSSIYPSRYYILFKHDLTYKAIQDGHVENGQWEYDAVKQKITFFYTTEKVFKLKEISATRLVMTMTFEGEEADILFRKISE